MKRTAARRKVQARSASAVRLRREHSAEHYRIENIHSQCFQHACCGAQQRTNSSAALIRGFLLCGGRLLTHPPEQFQSKIAPGLENVRSQESSASGG